MQNFGCQIDLRQGKGFVNQRQLYAYFYSRFGRHPILIDKPFDVLSPMTSPDGLWDLTGFHQGAMTVAIHGMAPRIWIEMASK